MWRPGRRVVIVAVVGAALAAAAVGAFAPPPRGETASASVLVVPVRPALLDDAGVRARVERTTIPGGTVYATGFGAVVRSEGVDPRHALERARRAALAYVGELRSREDRVLRRRARARGGTDAAARRLLEDPVRYRLEYSPAAASDAGRLAGAARAALAVVLLAALLVALLNARGRPPARRVLVPAAAVAGALAALGLSALTTGAYAALVVAAGLAAAFAAAVAGGRRAVRLQLAAVIVLAPLRGALLAVAQAVELPHELLLVNAVQPLLIASAVLWLLWRWRGGEPPERSRALVAGAALIAAAAVLGAATQTVGPTLYAIGLAQYLAYPFFALACWAVASPRDVSAATWILIAMSAVVASSILVQAAGITDFVQAASSEVRHGGATGSYLHASIFLGTLAPLWVVLAVVARTKRALAGAVAGFALASVALALTFGRAGFAIAAIGILLVTLSFRGRELRRVVAMLVAGLALAAPATVAGDAGPGKIADRIVSGFDWSGRDRGNEQRLEAMRVSLRRWRDAPLHRKVLGEGLAATGNAKQLADERTDSTESYPLKLLVEVGVVGLLLVGGFLVWAAVLFVRTALSRAVDPLARAAAAGGFALTLDSVLYPTLETQILGMTWWLLLLLALLARRDALGVLRLDGFRLGSAERVHAPVAGPPGDEREGAVTGGARP